MSSSDICLNCNLFMVGFLIYDVKSSSSFVGVFISDASLSNTCEIYIKRIGNFFWVCQSKTVVMKSRWQITSIFISTNCISNSQPGLLMSDL